MRDKNFLNDIESAWTKGLEARTGVAERDVVTLLIRDNVETWRARQKSGDYRGALLMAVENLAFASIEPSYLKKSISCLVYHDTVRPDHILGKLKSLALALARDDMGDRERGAPLGCLTGMIHDMHHQGITCMRPMPKDKRKALSRYFLPSFMR